MKLFKDVIKENKFIIIFYVLIGIIINFIDLYSVTYYQKILDAFQYKTLTFTPLIIYGILLITSTILGYIENYPEQKVKHGLYFDFKLQALKKMKTIKDVDEIYVLDKGIIVEKGSYKELLNKDGYFTKLYKSAK